MIYTFISNIEKLNKANHGKTDVNVSDLLNDNVPQGVREYIEDGGTVAVKLCRIGAYNTLAAALRLFFGKTNFDIARNEFGKPILNEHDGSFSGIYINLSHSGDLCAVTVSDDGEVGVDVQSEISKERADRLGGRFFENLKLPTSYPDVEYMMYEVDEQGVVHIADLPELLCVTDRYFDRDFTAKWTLGESVLKCCGAGFGAVGEVDNLIKKMRTEIVKIKIGGRQYRVATATVK